MRKIWTMLKKGMVPVITMLVTFMLLKSVFLIGYVPTESMEPTLERGSYIIGRRIYSNLETGDIILFRHNGKLLVKRVAAVGGDTAEKNGISMTVPEARCYFLGDNADSSYDSRYWLNPFVDGADVAVKLIS